MKCDRCNSEMKAIICTYVTVNRCPNGRHKEVLEWDERFLENGEEARSNIKEQPVPKEQTL